MRARLNAQGKSGWEGERGGGGVRSSARRRGRHRVRGGLDRAPLGHVREAKDGALAREIVAVTNSCK